jgi:hypothetical protein
MATSSAYLEGSRAYSPRDDTKPSWESLRKQAKHFENELDVKLVTYNKLATSSSTFRNNGPENRGGRTRVVEANESEIEGLLNEARECMMPVDFTGELF